jgi:hypothetical protein
MSKATRTFAVTGAIIAASASVTFAQSSLRYMGGYGAHPVLSHYLETRRTVDVTMAIIHQEGIARHV